jgi:hypothetical protein
MTESTVPSTTGTSANRGVKRGLPAIGLSAAEDAAAKLWAVARLGTASPEAFARQFDEKAKASGSTWDTRIAMLRGFKLVRFEDKQIGLSELGQQLLNTSDPSGQTKARQAAVMNLKAYRELVESFNGTELPAATALANKLQFEYGKTEDFAKRAAQAFADSLKHAEMLDEGNVVCKEGVRVSTAVVPPSTAPIVEEAPEKTEDEIQAVEIDRAFDDEQDNNAEEASTIGFEPNRRDVGTPNVSLALTLDLSNFRADEVIKIIGALGFGGRG